MKISIWSLSTVGPCVLAFAVSACNCGPPSRPGEGSSSGTDQVHPTRASAPGCADGEREGFVDISRYPDIAGCSGAWTIPGIHPGNPGLAPACPGLPTFDTTTPGCGRQAGDDGANPSGTGCNVSDLCAVGWHVCASAADVAARSPTGCSGSTRPEDALLFFATRQASNGCSVCALGTSTEPKCNSEACVEGCLQTEQLSNDFFGCGNFGAQVYGPCGVLDRFSNNRCTGLAGSPWSCSDATASSNNGFCEAYAVVKSDTSFGGVLCCRDDANDPPSCQGAAADPSTLWPPNHALVPIQITGVTDPDLGDQVSLKVTAISQDEARDGDGDGSTRTDGTGVGTDQPRVRVERSGTGDGRVYHIDFTATDQAGASCTGTVTVCVPHDQGQGSGCVDQGPLFDSTPP